MAINPNDITTFRKVTMQDLVNDAVERADKEALEWLKTESEKTIERNKNGMITQIAKPITSIRAEYAKKYLDFKKSAKSAKAYADAKKEKAAQARKAMFDAAFEKIK